MPTDSEKVLSERMRVDAGMEECDHDCGANAYADEVAALEQRVAAIMEGQELLKAQTVRIRAVLGGSTRDTPDGLPGDTEELARLTMQRIADLEAKLGEALAYMDFDPMDNERAGRVEIFNDLLDERRARLMEDKP